MCVCVCDCAIRNQRSARPFFGEITAAVAAATGEEPPRDNSVTNVWARRVALVARLVALPRKPLITKSRRRLDVNTRILCLAYLIHICIAPTVFAVDVFTVRTIGIFYCNFFFSLSLSLSLPPSSDPSRRRIPRNAAHYALSTSRSVVRACTVDGRDFVRLHTFVKITWLLSSIRSFWRREILLGSRNIATPSHHNSISADDSVETVSAVVRRVSLRLVKDTDLWPSRRKRTTTFADHFIVISASQKGDTIYMKFLDTVSPSLSRARSGSFKKLIEPFIGPATRCMSSLKYQGFSFRNLLEQDIKILLQPAQKIATIQGNVTGYT